MNSLRTSSVGNKGRAGLIALLAGLVVLASVASLAFGAVPIPPGEVVAALLGRGSGTTASIVLYARLPRLCGCLLAGAALACAGVIIQGVLNNPLAAPNVIGVNSGAGLATALCCALAPGAVRWTPLAAFLGALVGVLLVLFIAERAGAARITLVLAGVAMSSMFGAGIDAVVTFVPDALSGYTDFRVGGVKNLSMARLAPAFWVILIALLIALSLSNELDLLLLGRAHGGGRPGGGGGELCRTAGLCGPAGAPHHAPAAGGGQLPPAPVLRPGGRAAADGLRPGLPAHLRPL